MYVRWRRQTKDLFIQRLLGAWDDVLIGFEEAIGVDGLPYISGERSNVGHLAIAAHRIGAFPWYEPPLPEEAGRPDLYIWRPNKPPYWFEAKCLEIDRFIDFSPRDLARSASVRLGWAYQQAKKRDLPKDNVIALAFSPIQIYEETVEKFRWKPFKDYARNVVKNRGKVDFCAIHMCDQEIWGQGTKSDGIYPGVMIFGRIVRKQ